ncbi:TolB-like 6-blade propeller-like [Porphyromonadaceae bacterium KH3CP3RA]|nr:TolB-like 6-blade propeller-like [Porphyromonadaceae bacterium KH3CP3RA]
MKIYLSLVLCLFISLSCKENEKKIINNFNEIENVSHTPVKLDNDSFFSKVWKIYYVNDKLITYDVDNEFLFSITDLNKKVMLSKFGKLGQGPDEISGMVTTTSIVNKNTISFFEPNKSILYTINFENPTNLLLTEELSVKGIDMIMTLTPLSSDLFVATGIFEQGRFLLLDKAGKVISYNFDYPTFTNEEIFTHAHKAMAFQGKLAVRPDGKRFFFACEDSEVFEIIEITQNNNLNKIFEFHGELGNFKPEGDGRNSIAAAISRNSKKKFIDSYCTQDYIYLLYSNKVIGDNIYDAYLANTVLVFDWDGNPVKLLNLDTTVSNIAINENDRYMYAYSNDTEQLIRFTLE